MTGETKYSGSMSNESRYNSVITGDVKNKFDYFASIEKLNQLPLTLTEYTLIIISIMDNETKYG